MSAQRSQSKKKTTTTTTTITTSSKTTNVLLESSLTPMDWLATIQIGENPLPSSTTAVKESLLNQSVSLPITLSKTNIQQKLEPHEIELPTSTNHLKPPYSYVSLIRQAISSAIMQRMTLNEIYQWIVDSYPYFRTAPSKWKNSIRHNLSLNKCFKRLQRSTNDPGKGSYWAIDESNKFNHQSNFRKQRFKSQQSLSILSPSPTNINQKSTVFHTNDNLIIFDDGINIGGQSLSTDESDSTMSLAPNSTLIPWDVLNPDLSASLRRICEPILGGPSMTSITDCDPSSTNPAFPNSWSYDLFPHGETNSFLESIKLVSNDEIDWKDIDVKPYYDESITANRLPIMSNGTISEAANNLMALPLIIGDETFDWDSITQCI
ncbi:unnamed protein product [Rotaria sp. Silwood1]|nr:unnamed protein product [Rotaria sp. Silwood1]CAF4513956.1 unnamed protein product [Rotaria sp. Silwood1]